MSGEIYEPREDSFLLLKHVKNYENDSFLDMGTGSGILAMEASKYCKFVLACDKNKKAVKELVKLINKNNLINIRAVYSDLFSNIKQNFDIIMFNPPYLPSDPNYPDISLDGGKQGYEIIEKFLYQAKKFLRPKGKIVLLFSSLSKKGKIDKILENSGYRYKKIDQEKIDFEDLYIYEIWKNAE